MTLAIDIATDFDPESGIIHSPLLLLQAPAAPERRRFYLPIPGAVGALPLRRA